MWRRVIILFLVSVGELAAQESDGIEEVMMFLGAQSPEEVGEDDAERLFHYLRNPLEINHASLSQLVESGLLDRYRAASLHDYRTRHGDVFSLMELSLVDGFGEDYVRRLAPFISFDTYALPGERPSVRNVLRCDVALKAGARHNDGIVWMTGSKARLEYGDRLKVNLAATSPYGKFEPEGLAYSASILWRCPRLHARFIAGDFNARYGQGLLIWNGLTLGALSSPSAFMKNPTGLSQSSSFTGNNTFTGFAMESSIDRFTVSGFIALPEVKSFRGEVKDLALMPAINISYHWRYGQAAVTHYSSFDDFSGFRPTGTDHRSSFDTRWCLKGVDIFAEAVYAWGVKSFAALGGTVFPAGEHLKMSSMLRYYPSSFSAEHSGAMCSMTDATNEYGATISSELDVSGRQRLVSVLDAAHFPMPKKNDRGGSIQLKCLIQWEWQTAGWMTLKVRLSERYRTWGYAYRTDLRSDIQARYGDFRTNLRINALMSKGWGLLSYIEEGYEGDKVAVWLRQGFFRIDEWDDRIYAYERGAPGAFRVPAYYGRGLWTAMTLSSRFRKMGRLYLRIACTGYPFMPEEKRKPGKAELEIQYVCSF